MGWLREELWLDTDVFWFREASAGPSAAYSLHAPSFFGLPAAAAGAPAPTGLAASRQRRAERERRRQRTRTVPAVALAVGSTAMIPFVAQRQAAGPGVLQEDPPSLTFRLDPGRLEAPIPRRPGMQADGAQPPKAKTGAQPKAKTQAKQATEPRALASTQRFEDIHWHSATSTGLPYSGRLSNSTQLPLEGPDWVTWNPVTDSSPNNPGRLHGNEHTIRKLVDVLAAHRAAFPDAPRVVVGDISFEGGGPMNEHLSHQNGLDVDVYYPRLDRELRAPTSAAQVDHVLAQDMLDRFLAAGAQMVFVGYSTGLQGPGGVVVPWPHHENHMHVRFRRPAA
jgi:hypothetical protein